MNYQWARDTVLQLIDQYSVAGERVSLSYNNQADYVAKIPGLLDDAQVYAATTVRMIRKYVPLVQLEREVRGAFRIYALPGDCCRVSALVCFGGGEVRRSRDWHLLGNDYLAVGQSVGEDALLQYCRRPVLLGSDPEDDALLDNVLEVQMTLPYYAAAHLVMHDNAYAYQALLNEWEMRLARLAALPVAEMGITEDAYAVSSGGYV